MSYSTQAKIARDNMLLLRIAACASTQGVESPERWASERAWDFSSQSGWSDAYATAVSGGTPNPGDNAGVITDAMILTACQALHQPTSMS